MENTRRRFQMERGESETSDDVPELEDATGDRLSELGDRRLGYPRRGIASFGRSVDGVLSEGDGSRGGFQGSGREVLPLSKAESSSLSAKLTHGVIACSLVGLVFLIVIATTLPVYLFLVWRLTPSLVKTTQPIYFDYRLSSPTATVPLLPTDKLEASQAAKSLSQGPRAIPVGQKVDVWVKLHLPDSYSNRGLGIFQVTVQLLNSHGDVLTQATQPSIMRFRSYPFRLARSAMLIVPLICGFVEDNQDLKLHVIKGYIEREIPVTMVRVLLDARAGMPLKEGLPEVYSAELIVDSSLRGLRSIIHRWRLTSFVWGAFGLLVIEILVLLRCCRWTLVPKIWSKQAETVQSGATVAQRAIPQARPMVVEEYEERLSSENGTEPREVDEHDDASPSASVYERLRERMEARERERRVREISMDEILAVGRSEAIEAEGEEEEEEVVERGHEQVDARYEPWIKLRHPNDGMKDGDCSRFQTKHVARQAQINSSLSSSEEEEDHRVGGASNAGCEFSSQRWRGRSSRPSGLDESEISCLIQERGKSVVSTSMENGEKDGEEEAEESVGVEHALHRRVSVHEREEIATSDKRPHYAREGVKDILTGDRSRTVDETFASAAETNDASSEDVESVIEDTRHGEMEEEGQEDMDGSVNGTPQPGLRRRRL